jgi:translin
MIVLPTLKNIIKVIKRDLTFKEELREKTQTKMRKMTSLSKQAILLGHQKKIDEAKQRINDAKKLFAELKKLSIEKPAIVYTGMFSAALQEYAEANLFITLISEEKFLTFEEIDVPPVEYVLGMADVIGEFRRLILDTLREGKVELGEKFLALMDEIFIELLALDEAYMLVPGLRRKNDVSRRIIESTRGDVTQEIRRKSLEDYLRSFENKLFDQASSKKVE